MRLYLNFQPARTERWKNRTLTNRQEVKLESDVLMLSRLQQIEMAQKLLNSDLAELIGKMKLAQQYVMTR